MEGNQDHQFIKIELNPSNDSDKSKVIVRLTEGAGCSIKWFDCNESINNYIKPNESGLAKLERMKVAIELAEEHIKKQLKQII